MTSQIENQKVFLKFIASHWGYAREKFLGVCLGELSERNVSGKYYCCQNMSVRINLEEYMLCIISEGMCKEIIGF